MEIVFRAGLVSGVCLIWFKVIEGWHVWSLFRVGLRLAASSGWFILDLSFVFGVSSGNGCLFLQGWFTDYLGLVVLIQVQFGVWCFLGCIWGFFRGLV